MKFFKLFKKEIKELITLQSVISLIVGVGALMLLGQAMSGIGEDMESKMGTVVIADLDNSQLSQQSIEVIEKSGTKVHKIDYTTPEDAIKKANELDKHTSVAVIPKGFEAGIKSGTPQKIEIVSSLTSFSIMSNSDQSGATAAQIISDYVATNLLEGEIQNADVSFFKAPVLTEDVTVVKNKSDVVNSNMLMSFAMQQSIFIPIIVFILITFATQLNSAAIANEKTDKTLETLLSAPVSRLSVLGSKMCASGVFSLLMAGVYMLGFSSYMGGMMGGMGASGDVSMEGSGIGSALTSLGLKLGPTQYLLIGVQLFLTILIALAISMILGALAKDIKAAQGLMMPLMFFTMIPYFVTMFLDINSLPIVAKVLINLIPFTHTFTASSNLLFGNMSMFYIGMIYQVIVLLVVSFIAVRVFSTDKIFTMTLEFNKKKKVKA